MPEPVVRFETLPGIQIQADWKHLGVWPLGEELVELHDMVAILGSSRRPAIRIAASCTREVSFERLVRCLDDLGGVTREILTDRDSVVCSNAPAGPLFVPEWVDLCELLGTVPRACRAYRAQTKAAAEAGVLVVERWVLAPLRHRQFFALADLNVAIRERVAAVNARQFRGQPTSRRDLFEELERPALQPLPPTRYEFTAIKKATVNIDYHVEAERHFYSVPHRYVRQKVEVWITAETIAVYHGHRRVASHVREYGKQRYITDPAHMPASHRAHLEWTPQRLIKWAGTVGPAAAAVTERILETKPHPEHGYRACLGLMSLARRHGDARVHAACARALSVNAVSYTSVKSILTQHLDTLPLPQVQLSLVPPPPLHENLRGASYYAVEREA